MTNTHILSETAIALLNRWVPGEEIEFASLKPAERKAANELHRAGLAFQADYGSERIGTRRFVVTHTGLTPAGVAARS